MVCEGQVRQRLKNLKLPLNIKTDEILPKQTSLTFDLAEMQIWIWGICWSGTLRTSGSLARSARPSSEDSLHRCIVGYFWFKTQWLWTDFTLELHLTPCIETKVLSLISTSSQRRRHPSVAISRLKRMKYKLMLPCCDWQELKEMKDLVTLRQRLSKASVFSCRYSFIHFAFYFQNAWGLEGQNVGWKAVIL